MIIYDNSQIASVTPGGSSRHVLVNYGTKSLLKLRLF